MAFNAFRSFAVARPRLLGLITTPIFTSFRRTALSTSYAALNTGDAFTAIGSGFANGAQIELTNLSTAVISLLSTTYVSPTQLTVAIPAMFSGDYSARVINPGMLYSAATMPFAVVRLPESMANVKGSYSQRGDANDYSPGALKWTDRTGNGLHILATAGSAPPVTSTALDGKYAIDRSYQDYKYLPQQSFFPSSYWTQTAMSIIQIAKFKFQPYTCNITTTTESTNIYASPRIFSMRAGGDYSGFWAGGGTNPNTVTFGFSVYDGPWTKAAILDSPINVIGAQVGRHDGVNIMAAYNAPPSTGNMRSCGTKQIPESTYEFIFQGNNTDASETYELYCGQMTDGECREILRFATLYNLPSSGISAPATLINPASLNLSLWIDARDFTGATFPAQPTWNSRASAGTSGNNKIVRNTTGNPSNSSYAATKNPVAVSSYINGNQIVRFDNTSFTDHAACRYADKTSGTFLRTTDLFSTTNGFTFHTVVCTPRGPSAVSPYCASVWGPEYSSGVVVRGPSLTPGDSTWGVLGGNTQDASYMSAAVTTPTPAASNLVCVQGTYDPSTRILSIRFGKGAFGTTTLAVGADILSANEIMMLCGYLFANNYGASARIDIAEVMFSPTVLSMTVLNQLVDRAADPNNWGNKFI